MGDSGIGWVPINRVRTPGVGLGACIVNPISATNNILVVERICEPEPRTCRPIAVANRLRSEHRGSEVATCARVRSSGIERGEPPVLLVQPRLPVKPETKA